jgi:F-type H+-transporting ATPase subunit delta
MSRRIARPYAKALFQVMQRQGLDVLREVESQLAVVAEAFAHDERVLRVFEVPSVAPSAKRSLLQTLGSALALRPEVQRTLAALAQHLRLRMLADVVTAFRELVDRREGKVRGLVEVPVALTAEQLGTLERALGDVVRSRVELEARERPELLAGFVVRIGSLVFDGSLRARVARFAHGGHRRET